ncbi:hypothetical protein CLAFUW4_13664 [Fulvia fulva]|uniref:Uncharacterized protein n=1 Tax=Passalora fulva TaxID=5499 RepID=A0A9Q8PL14_PASFU|nr:uncharacterized protein CLAFUR5_13513 [Fulvia fulva]KAK4610559.1 hypothetical protein CLAFUR4_13667 [Fulvia fulva]KAK4610983.1 hypothetical protein CLAFUR0_13671 [Fulvia fulva]UJO24423.1 hypothetical protein CLAFUR5_13513 [Fulvia fulva]WPV22379.1 hypothetical protein CLAFUW4_13664 [Fulvia fulva]WPV36792.1 hypothetical protein CLAFUW7_13672 [Fulvia fulva]
MSHGLAASDVDGSLQRSDAYKMAQLPQLCYFLQGKGELDKKLNISVVSYSGDENGVKLEGACEALARAQLLTPREAAAKGFKSIYLRNINNSHYEYYTQLLDPADLSTWPVYDHYGTDLAGIVTDPRDQDCDHDVMVSLELLHDSCDDVTPCRVMREAVNARGSFDPSDTGYSPMLADAEAEYNSPPSPPTSGNDTQLDSSIAGKKAIDTTEQDAATVKQTANAMTQAAVTDRKREQVELDKKPQLAKPNSKKHQARSGGGRGWGKRLRRIFKTFGIARATGGSKPEYSNPLAPND